MKELEVDVFALETRDIQDARKNSDWTTKAIGLIMVLFFCSYVGLDYAFAAGAKLNGINQPCHGLSWRLSLRGYLISFRRLTEQRLMSKLLDQLRIHEGVRRHVYLCSAGYETIGVGKKYCGVWSRTVK